MNNWKINIYRNKDDQDVLCCTVVASGDNEKDAELLAEKYHAMTYPSLSKNIRVKSCGKSAQKPDKGENVSLLSYNLPHPSDVEAQE
jgi:hypothetical protein